MAAAHTATNVASLANTFILGPSGRRGKATGSTT